MATALKTEKITNKHTTYYTVVRQLQCNWERTISKTVYKGRFQFSCRTRIF